jgi:ankyrin repeat protein
MLPEDKDPQTQLYCAAIKGDLVRMKQAIRSGADVNVNSLGSSPLHDACVHGQKYAAKFLMRLGADIDCQDDMGSTPLMCVINEGYPAPIPKELLLRGADPNIANARGDTAIQLAAFNNRSDVVELLLKSGAEDRRDTPCSEKIAMDEFHEDWKRINLMFNDDRMFVFEIAPVTTTNPNPQLISHSTESKEWAVITHRNVTGYPSTQIITFPTRSDAVAHYEKVVVETPRVSLEKSPPNPKLSLMEYTSWLKTENYYDPLLNPDAPTAKAGD